MIRFDVERDIIKVNPVDSKCRTRHWIYKNQRIQRKYCGEF